MHFFGSVGKLEVEFRNTNGKIEDVEKFWRVMLQMTGEFLLDIGVTWND